MNDPNLLAGKDCLDFVSSVEAIVRRSCIIDYGIVQKIPADGIVEVSVAVSDTPQNLYYMTCVLANLAGSSVAVNVKPNIGDRVLVVYPRIYDEDMFTVPDSDTDKVKIKVNKQARGYNLMSGIAILLNQYKTASHKNYIEIDNGIMDPFMAIVLDTGGAMRSAWSNGNILIDIAFPSEYSNGVNDATNKSGNVKFKVYRNGW